MVCFSEKYYFRLNRFKATIRILGALYIVICFLARTNYLHLGQYQALSSSRIYGYLKRSKQSAIVIPADFLEDFESSETLLSSIFYCISLAFFTHYISIYTFFTLTSDKNLSSLNLSTQPSHSFFPQYSHELYLVWAMVRILIGFYLSGTLITSF